MVSKLAAALLAPLLIAIVWPVSPSIMKTDRRVSAANVTSLGGKGPQAAAPTGRQRLRDFNFPGTPSVAKGAHPVRPRLPASLPIRRSASRHLAASAAISTRPINATSTVAPKGALYNNLNSTGLTPAIAGPIVHSPPDSTGAIGPNNYVEMVNSGIKVWTRTLAPVLGAESSLANWVGVPPDTNYCDPQIQWDPTAGRWLYAFIQCDPTGYQEIDFGWSRTSSPTLTNWCQFYQVSTPAVFDFPKLGHNSHYMILGGNVFDTAPITGGPVFVGVVLEWAHLPANGVTTCTPPGLQQNTNYLLNGDTSLTITAVPVNTTTGAANGYVVSAHADNATLPRNTLSVWHIDSLGGLHQDPDIPVASFANPSPAPELGSSNTIDTSDARLTQAVGDPTTGIWTQHTVDGPGGRSVVRWYEIKVSGGLPTLTQQGDMASSTDFVFNGAISPRADAGGAAVVYNRSSATIDPVIAAQIRLTSTPAGTMEPGELVLGTSAAADTDFTCDNPDPGTPCRWGDYSGASPDPVNKNVVWGTSEVNTATGDAPAWLDRNFALSFVTTPHAPTAVAATAADHSAYVSWTNSTFVPSSTITSYTITSYVGTTAGTHIVVGASTTIVHFTGLTNGVTYTFTVIATNGVGDSPESVHSNAVTPTRKAAQTTPAASSSRINIGPAPPSPPPARP
jgi:hypothetical protein